MYMCIYKYISWMQLRSDNSYASKVARDAYRIFVHLECIQATANLRTSTKILDFGGFDSSIILILRGGLLMSIGKSLEILSQGILVGIIKGMIECSVSK